jgi:hypothetical protein
MNRVEINLLNAEVMTIYGHLAVQLQIILFFFIIISGVRLSPLDTVSTTGLLYQPEMIDNGDCGTIVGMKIGMETEVLGENLPQCHSVQHRSRMTRPGLEPGPPRWEAGD